MKKIAYAKRQHGAALIVGLVLLVVITVLAISGMNTATTELAMARNDQNYENAFQAAETGLEQALGQGRFDTVADIAESFTINTNDQVLTLVQFETTSLVPDGAFSIGVGTGMSAYHFNITATAESKRAGTGGAATDRDATAVHTQAFYVVGPGSPAL